MTRSAVPGERAGRPALLGIDLGTSSVKAVVTDLDGTRIGQAIGEYPVVRSCPGWSETEMVLAIRQERPTGSRQ
jgi:xylulokinase